MRRPAPRLGSVQGSVGLLVRVSEALTKWRLEAVLEQGGSLSEALCLEGRKCHWAVSQDPTDIPPGSLWEMESGGGPEDSPKLTEELEPWTPGGHSRAQDKPEGTPGPPGATTGALHTASVGAERDAEATTGGLGRARVTQELVTGGMGRGRAAVGKPLRGAVDLRPGPHGGGQGRVRAAPRGRNSRSCRPPALSNCPGCLLLSALALASASKLAQAVDVGHGSWFLAVGEKCPGLLAHGGLTTAVASGESALVT